MPALIFDCDGVLADTEVDGHLRAFNEMFTQLGVPVQWSLDDYAEKVRIGGGKERLASLFSDPVGAELGIDEDARAETVALWHRTKTEIYTRLVSDGLMPARPGIARIVAEAHAAGWTLAMASTSAEASVRAVLEHAVGVEQAKAFRIFAGDAVTNKKPSPDIYLLALDELGISADDAVVIEDSENGMRAANAAHLRTIVTTSTLTHDENFDGASLVVTCLGSTADGVELEIASDPFTIAPRGEVQLTHIQKVLAEPLLHRGA
ncbi:HAD-IA family hydrolase [Salinibacterium sp. NK8237]|uniref:HAD-IA family hydrolase n=1 Tax=Salinibacterium sp. NK8237 TaxID=2792038 RepID=UPI0018CE0F4D|nr:HAD-IA family hydrolase [Salinibacterium sp. NK8237]MBH0130213.1 HAD-IA family hydrolase [Salinibacterium sp. NK8237]